jgi:sigma-B regulation protein RsbU (phosphoserine phosphatase)
VVEPLPAFCSSLADNLRGQIVAFHDAQEERLLARAPADPGELPRSQDATGAGKRIGRILERVNRLVAGSMLEANYITLFYAEFDERSSRLNYVNAGHNPPLLVRQDLSVEKLEQGGTVVGLFREVAYDVGEIEVNPKDTIVAFTDGLIEARNASGEELGEERLIGLVRQTAQLSATEAEKSLLSSVREWTGDAEQEDDLTLVVIKHL